MGANTTETGLCYYSVHTIKINEMLQETVALIMCSPTYYSLLAATDFANTLI